MAPWRSPLPGVTWAMMLLLCIGRRTTPDCLLPTVCRVCQRRVMEDEALLSDHNIKDDGVVYMVLQTGE